MRNMDTMSALQFVTKERAMHIQPREAPARWTVLVLTVAAALTVPTLASAADTHGKRRASRWHGYGFLPGYVPPEQFDPLRPQPRGY